MKVGLIVELEDVAQGYTPVAGGVEYVDMSGARVFIPMKLLVRLYEGAKWHHERNSDQPWERYCGHLFIEEGK
jgi:hypothetical protein